MTTEIPEMKKVLVFVERYLQQGILSTSAKVVNFTNGLYNVDGSTYDPKKVPGHDGEAWKQLLISYGINANCYVTNPNPEGSHPDFSVGGHMTTNSNGNVPEGGKCYLMPLCFWHNSTSKNGILFTHSATKMLELSGYMQGELAVTFKLRLPSKEPFAVLYYSEEEGWNYQDLTEKQAMNLKSDFLQKLKNGDETKYVLFERVREPQTMHYIRKTNLPTSK